MSEIISLTSNSGKKIEFINERKASGGMKDVYFSPQKDYVVCIIRDSDKFDDKTYEETKKRLELICGIYREKMFNQIGGDYLKNLYYWPTDIVEWQNKIGVIVPFYDKCFFFENGKLKGKEKDGKWFASPNLRKNFVPNEELGNWRDYLKICILISRAVRRMHSAGLAHSDLSYKNCLINPTTEQGNFTMAALTDIDSLVVPGKLAPEVIGTPDFIAPEVLATSNLEVSKRILPSRYTDLHALAVLIYMYLLYRHPLRGKKVFDKDPDKDEELGMGEKALFVEHPTDESNRINLSEVRDFELPWKDTNKLPYTICGPYLAKLFERAFIDGLHEPSKRPSAEEWEVALVKTVDLLQPCANPDCSQKWYAFNNSYHPKCPFCGTEYKGKLPVLNLYSATPDGKFHPDNHRIMVYSGQSIFKWHSNKTIFPNEKLTEKNTKRVAYFILHNKDWYLVNENLPEMVELNKNGNKSIPLKGKIKLQEGVQIILEKGLGGRLLLVQMAG